jgi:HK97 gp10 family phage protein
MITIKLQGFDKTIKDVQKLATDANKNAKTALVDFGTRVETEAKRNAPADEGKLRSSINSTFNQRDFTVKITVATDYAAYQEFGTRKFAAAYVGTLPQEWRTYAATFKGKTGGSMDEFIQAIMAWVRRKGIGADTTKSGNVSSSASSLEKQQQAAYWIAINILQNGIKPKKFLYEAVKDNLPKLQSDFNKIFS